MGGNMKFAWDVNKAAANKKKHGVSFEEAQAVFDDADALRIYDPDHSEDEDRFVLLGLRCAVKSRRHQAASAVLPRLKFLAKAAGD
jgi:uncharacterized DUF497 family protein